MWCITNEYLECLITVVASLDLPFYSLEKGLVSPFLLIRSQKTTVPVDYESDQLRPPNARNGSEGNDEHRPSSNVLPASGDTVWMPCCRSPISILMARELLSVSHL